MARAAGAWGAKARRRGTALLAAFALLLQTVLLLVHQPPVPPELVKVSHAGRAAHHHHHHHHDDGPVPEKAPTKQDAGPHCPLCFRLHLAGTFVPPSEWVFSPPALTHVVADLAAEAPLLVAAEPWSGARARAPPEA